MSLGEAVFQQPLCAILQLRLPPHIGVADKIAFGVKFTDQGFSGSNRDLFDAGFIEMKKKL